MLWMAGQKKKCTLCLVQDKSGFEVPAKEYKKDGLTERVSKLFKQYINHIFKVRKIALIEETISSVRKS